MSINPYDAVYTLYEREDLDVTLEYDPTFSEWWIISNAVAYDEEIDTPYSRCFMDFDEALAHGARLVRFLLHR